METLEIESTERTPGIKFDYDHHYFEINGEAYPENSDEFFRQQKVEIYCKKIIQFLYNFKSWIRVFSNLQN